ncbi:MAG: helix-turn-helix transcriptional regulator [Scrofimicrobium sp.]
MAIILEALGLDENDPEFLEVREDFNEFADLIGALVARRRALGLTQTQVAARMGTKQSAVSAMEYSSANPSIQRLQRYARAVGARVTLGFEEIDEPAASATAASK